MYDSNFPGGAGVVRPSKPPPPYQQLSPLPTLCFRMFLERSLNDPHPLSTPLQASFTATPFPIHHPFFPHKNVDHTLRCSALVVFKNMSVVSDMFLYPSRNDGGPHRNCALYTRVIPSVLLRKL